MQSDQMEYLFVRVTHIEPYGLFVSGPHCQGLIHVSEVTYDWCDDIWEYAEEDDVLLVRALETDNPHRCRFSLKDVPEEQYLDWRTVAERQFGSCRVEARVREVDKGRAQVTFGIPSFTAELLTKSTTLEELDDVRIELSGYDPEKRCFLAKEAER